MKTTRLILWIILFPIALFNIMICILAGYDWKDIKNDMLGRDF